MLNEAYAMKHAMREKLTSNDITHDLEKLSQKRISHGKYHEFLLHYVDENIDSLTSRQILLLPKLIPQLGKKTRPKARNLLASILDQNHPNQSSIDLAALDANTSMQIL